jgi:hypothetical protein
MLNNVKPYLEYLDKEMTIMGILSAFCIGTAALVAKEVLKISDEGQLFWAHQADFYYIVTGSGLMLVAAGAFYWQRASLAWHFGQVSLWATDAMASGRPLLDILQESDTWTVWIPYQAGLWLTAAGILAYFGALLPVPEELEVWYVLVLAIAVALVVLAVAIVRLRRDREMGDVDQPETPRRLGKRRKKSRTPNERLERGGHAV